MPSTAAPRIAVGPDRPHTAWIAESVARGGGHVVPVDQAEALVWVDPRDTEGLEAALRGSDNIRWVQLPLAGIEGMIHLVDDHRQWTCGKGVYAEPVAELALSLALAGMRNLSEFISEKRWGGQRGINLLGARVTILGGGGITESLVRLLQPFDCHITVVRNRVRDMDGVDDVLESDRYADALSGADLVVLALALTSETQGIIARDELEMMEPHAWLVNVARGKHVVTDDLVWALGADQIGGAGLDVVDPEPLPEGHPLWSFHNCIITPHVGSTPQMAQRLLAERIETNVRRFAAGEELIGPVHLDLGY